MALPFADYLTDTADILVSTADSGEIRVNLGDSVSGAGYDSDVPVWGPDGFLSRPNDPTDAGAAMAFYVTDGNQKRVIGIRDNRFASQAGLLDAGDRAIVTDGPARLFLKQVRAAISAYTEMANDPPAGGKGMLFDMDGSTGIITIRCGGAQIIIDGNKGTISIVASGAAGAASMTLDPVNGISLNGGVVNLDAGFVTLGLNSDGSRPVKPAVETVILGAVGQSGVASPKIYGASF